MFAGSQDEAVVCAPIFTSLRGARGRNTAGEISKACSIHA
jgi:hypothetical protein